MLQFYNLQIGEEYLILLPECLSYLSELLEDDDDTVSGLAGETIRYIESISGETLADYMN